MANGDERKEHTQLRNDWEVVSLTASAYAASFSPHNVELTEDRKYDAYDTAETSRAFFMSGHFVFPPSEHEDLPVEPFLTKTHDDNASKDIDSLFEPEEEKQIVHNKKKDSTTKGVNLSNEFPGTQFRDETLDFIEQSTYGGSANGSLHGGEPKECPEGGLDFTYNASNPIRLVKDDKHSACNLPCEAWWRRRVTSVYSHAKETNAFWSVFIAATLTGLIVLGHRWQQDRHNFQ